MSKYVSLLAVLFAVSVSSSLAQAKRLSTPAQKIQFAGDAITNVLLAKQSGYSLVPNSIELKDCTRIVDHIGSFVANKFATGSFDCNVATFYVHDAEEKLFAGKVYISTESKNRRRFGVVLTNPEVRDNDVIYHETLDSETKQPIFLGLHPVSLIKAQDQTASSLLNLQPATSSQQNSVQQ